MFDKKSVMRIKPIGLSSDKEGLAKKITLKKTMGAFSLTALGVGAIIGTGIFVLTGIASANYAGPAVIFSFVISGFVAALAALCYAELASMDPVAGSAYSFVYSSIGEIIAWLIGWNLILEYMVASGAVAVGWSSYFSDMLKSIGFILPDAVTKSPFEGGIINIPAVIIILLISWLVISGSSQSAKATKIIVSIKLIIIIMFLVLGVSHIDTANWTPFAPFGLSGIMHGAAIVFFAYIGFDAVATAAEEVKNPKRDLPIGIICSLIISTVLYIAVAAVLTGMQSYTKLDTPSPITSALLAAGIRWASALISVGAVAGLTSVLIAVIFAQSRIFFSMSRDGLLPPIFSVMHKKYRTPYINTLLIGIFASLIGAFFPVGFIAEMANIGTLSAFTAVAFCIIILRKKRPEIKRPFSVPLVPLLPLASIVSCIYLMINLPLLTWIRFAVWIIIGLLIYFFYGHSHSKLASNKKDDGASNLET